jgi:DNA helicase-2/ATP-dependent DNA helicase PcrA
MTQTATKPPWLEDVKGNQVLEIINPDDDIILVEAGPGTGKTFGLIRRVQRILHPEGLGVPGKAVLVVAFNRAIAKQLRQEVGNLLKQSPHDGEPIIRTIHALCLEVMGSDLRILLPHEEEAMLYDVLCEHPDLNEKYKTLRHVKQAFHNHVAKIEDHPQLRLAIKPWLIQHKAQLIGELPHLLLNRLQGGDFADKTYQHVIVDEFQDLTPGEQELFLKLRGQGGKLVALGDPRQSIYAFRGNDLEGLNKISKLYASSTKISMTECRRCPEEIVEAANRLMGLYKTEPMVPKGNSSANTHVVVWKSLRAESEGMAKAIVENIQAHPEEKHLVMVTRRQFGYRLREQISKLNPDLNIELSFSESLLETWAVREAFLYFCLLADPDAPTWRAWLGYKNSNDGKDFKGANLNAAAYLKFLDKCKDKITEGAVKEIANCPKQPPGEGGKNLWGRAKRFVELKTQLQWDGEDVLALLKEVFDTSKWNGDQSPDPETAKFDMEIILSKAHDIYQELLSDDPELTVQEQLKEVAVKLRYGIATRESFASDEQSDLHVATLWGAKGVTANHVYIIGLCDEAIPGPYQGEYPGTEKEFFEEQRRLFYVSITRCRKTLVLSRAKQMPQGEAARLGLSKGKGNLQMSTYLHDIIDCLPDYQEGEDWKGCV